MFDISTFSVNLGNVTLVISQVLVIITSMYVIARNNISDSTRKILYASIEVGLGWTLHRLFWIVATANAAHDGDYWDWSIDNRILTLIPVLLVAHGTARIIQTVHGFRDHPLLMVFWLAVSLTIVGAICALI